MEQMIDDDDDDDECSQCRNKTLTWSNLGFWHKTCGLNHAPTRCSSSGPITCRERVSILAPVPTWNGGEKHSQINLNRKPPTETVVCTKWKLIYIRRIITQSNVSITPVSEQSAASAQWLNLYSDGSFWNSICRWCWGKPSPLRWPSPHEEHYSLSDSAFKFFFAMFLNHKTSKIHKKKNECWNEWKYIKYINT